jgi:hypothetical protein
MIILSTILALALALGVYKVICHYRDIMKELDKDA